MDTTALLGATTGAAVLKWQGQLGRVGWMERGWQHTGKTFGAAFCRFASVCGFIGADDLDVYQARLPSPSHPIIR